MLTFNGSALRVNGGTLDYVQPSPPPTTVVIGGKTYPTVIMPDGNEWLAVNLDYAWTGLSVPTSGASRSSDPQAVYYYYNESTYGWNGYKCGLLYNWAAVDYLEQHKATLCPGWHVPTDAEWQALATAVGGYSDAGSALKASDYSIQGMWPYDWGGQDTYGFAVLPAGRFNNYFEGNDDSAFLWTVGGTEYLKFYVSFSASTAALSFSSTRIQTSAYQLSVRLVKDAQ